MNVYYVIASNPHTPAEVLAKLASAPDYLIRKQVAANPNTPDEILEELSKDSSWEVRLNVALNPVADCQLVERLAKDTEVFVRLGIAKHYDVPVEVLNILIHDENTDVACKSMASLKMKRYHEQPVLKV